MGGADGWIFGGEDGDGDGLVDRGGMESLQKCVCLCVCVCN